LPPPPFVRDGPVEPGGLGRPDVFPVEDLGVRRGMHVVFGDDLDRSRMTAIAERWRPYRSYATLYLWRAVE